MVASDSGEFKEFNFTADLLEADVPDALRAATRYSTQIRAVNSVGGGGPFCRPPTSLSLASPS